MKKTKFLKFPLDVPSQFKNHNQEYSLNSNDKLLLSFIEYKSNPSFYMSINNIAINLDLSVSSIKRSLKKLKESGIIYSPGKRYGVIVYQIDTEALQYIKEQKRWIDTSLIQESDQSNYLKNNTDKNIDTTNQPFSQSNQMDDYDDDITLPF